MTRFRALLLYASLALAANPAAADPAALEALRAGTMAKLRVHEAPRPVAPVAFTGEDGAAISLAAYRGRHVLVNFWAVWCAPCRREMPALAALQARFAGAPFAVVTIATGRNPAPAVDRFFAELGIDNLPRHRDPKQLLARRMGVFGLPASILLDPAGNEIARLQGEADWAGAPAKAIVAALLAGG